jgi:hypothetical protein
VVRLTTMPSAKPVAAPTAIATPLFMRASVRRPARPHYGGRPPRARAGENIDEGYNKSMNRLISVNEPRATRRVADV